MWRVEITLTFLGIFPEMIRDGEFEDVILGSTGKSKGEVWVVNISHI
jgi:hypothetical protein